MSKLLLPRGYRSAELLQRRMSEQTEARWIRRGKKRAFDLFHAMANRVPAYKDFLKSNGFQASRVRNVSDFHLIPPVDKKNYLLKYSKEMLCWDGEFAHGQWVISTTSGSTGQPYYFPREHSQDYQYAVTAELYLRSNFKVHQKSTLYVVAFPMGAWIGGLFTYEALKITVENSGYDMSIITPGINKREVINAIKQLGDSFDQIIIGAYAPFLKDILDDGAKEGIEWERYNLGFVFSAEAFTEAFRDYVLRVARPKDELRATLNHYGTVDLGTMAHETPESILIRRELVKNDKLSVLFPEKLSQPTFAQFNPELFYFENLNDSLLCSAYSGIPLVRYDLKDYGGVLRRDDVHKTLSKAGINITQLMEENAIADAAWNHPFVYVYERKDLSVSYYAFLIYPDVVRRALQTQKAADSITGKFTMQVDYSKDGRQQLNIHIEKKSGVKDSQAISTRLQSIVHEKLMIESSEYRETANTVGEVVKPLIHLWNYEDATYFKSGAKQKWVIK